MLGFKQRSKTEVNSWRRRITTRPLALSLVIIILTSLVISVFPHKAKAAISFVQEIGTYNTTATTSTTSVTVPSGGVPAGDLLTVSVSIAVSATVTITDSSGNVYTLYDRSNAGGGTTHYSAFAYAVLSTALNSGNTITATWSDGTFQTRQMKVAEYSGVSSTDRVDIMNSNFDDTFPESKPIDPGSITTNNSGDLVVVSANSFFESSQTYTTPTNYTAAGSTLNNGAFNTAQYYRVLSGTSTENPTINLSASAGDYWNVWMFAFKASGSSPIANVYYINHTASGPSTGSSATGNINVSGTNPVLILQIGFSSATAIVSSVSWNLGSGTPYEIKNNHNGSSFMSVWAVPAPTTGSGTYTVNLSASVAYNIDGEVFNGVDQTTPAPTGDAVVSNNSTNSVVQLSPLNAGSSDAIVGGTVSTGSTTLTAFGPNMINLSTVATAELSTGYRTGQGVVTSNMSATGGSASSIAIRLAPSTGHVAPNGVTFDSSSDRQKTSSAGTTLSWTAAGVLGTNTIVFVAVAVGNSTDTGATVTVTYGGVSMISVSKVHSNNQTAGYVQLFKLINPATGSKTVTVTNLQSSDMEGVSVSFRGADQSTGVGTPVTNFGSGTAPTVTVSSASGHMVLSAISNGSAINTIAQNNIYLANNNTSTAGGNGAASFANGASSVTMSYSVTTDWWANIGVDILPASTNSTPAAPTLISPSSGATNVTLGPTFQLRTTDADNDYLRYKINLCTDSLCNTVLQTFDQTSSQTGWSGQDQQSSTAYAGNSSISSSTIANYTVQTVLTTNTTYYWRAYAIDPNGTNTFSSASSIQSFTTTSQASSVQINGGTDIEGGTVIQ